jgi:uncharacterized protein
MDINKRLFAITGASRGIGKALALNLAGRGARLILISREVPEALLAECREAGSPGVESFPSDLTLPSETERLSNFLIEKKIDGIVNNAGLLTGGLIEEQPMDDIAKMLQINVNAVIQLSRAVIPFMVARKSGKIINNASVSAIMHFPCASTYAASKAAIYAFTNCIRQELADTGVTTLTLITPGIKTKMFDDISGLYGDHLKMELSSITAEEYAEQIAQAIDNDQAFLTPKGATGAALSTAKHFPLLFEKLTRSRFKR